MSTTEVPSLSALAIDVEAHVATVTLKAVGKANRMGPAFWRELPEAFAWLDGAAEVRAVILRGEGANFSFGLDLAAMGAETAESGLLAAEVGADARMRFLAHVDRLQRAISSVAVCRKPVIAAVAGWCVGGGVDLITACDFRLCSSDARFSVREVKLAIVADVGTLARLPAIVGPGHARRLAFTGEDIDAARAARIGLVEDVYDDAGALFAAAKALAGAIAENSPLAVQGVKRVLNAQSERVAEESLRTVALWNAAFLPSHDFREAIAAFLEKRKPAFLGK
jgi:enoyl-CoA hydratase